MALLRLPVALVVLQVSLLVAEAKKKAPPPPPPPPTLSPTFLAWSAWIAAIVGGFLAIKMGLFRGAANKPPPTAATTDPALAASTRGVADMSKSGRNAWGISMAKM